MCKDDLTSKDYAIILDLLNGADRYWGGLDQHGAYVFEKVKKLYAWSLL